uniref:Fatty acid desaturase N-terminal domain-containing protein n=1 Tax=Opuntia streptacantha TaxID=393608 RepID=A0A7C8YDV3_OPUST
MASLSNPKNDPKLEPEFDSLINREKMSGVERENKEGEEFDHGAPPPFKLADIRAAIPKHCWVKDPWKSMSYVVRDVIVIFALMIVAGYLDSWVVWPFYWFAQGILFCALFAIGHDWYVIFSSR